MRGRQNSDDLQYDPEIERTARANRKAVWLSKSVPPSARVQIPVLTFTEAETVPSPKTSTMGDADPPPRPKLGDYGLATNRCCLTHVFRPANPFAFHIKASVQNGLKERQFDGRETISPHEHLRHFAKTCEFCVPPANVTEDQKKLRLFPFTLTGKAKDWLFTLPNGTIQTWEELELNFLEKFFPMSKYLDKKQEIENFRQGESESLYDAWERFNLLLKRCPGHEFSDK